MRSNADAAAALTLLAFAAFTIREARKLPYWHEHAPGPGFFPFWLGVALAVGAAVIVVTVLPAFRLVTAGHATGARREAVERAGGEPGSGIRTLAWVGALSIAAMPLAMVVGMPLASGLYMAAVLFRLEPRRLRRNLVASALASLLVWLVFVQGLGVPLPVGPLGF